MVVEPFDIRQYDQRRCIRQRRYQRRQGIVVADTDLIHRGSIVLIDNRDRFELQEGVHCVAGVDIPLPISEIVLGEQHLRDIDPQPSKFGGVEVHQESLANCGRRLLLWNGLGSSRQLQRLHSGGDGSTGDENRGVSSLRQFEHILRQPSNVIRVWISFFIRKSACADFDHKSLQTSHRSSSSSKSSSI